MIIKLTKVTKNFNNLTVLKDIDLEIKSKELLCIIGPSGSGKSTILRSIIGLEKISSGKITFDDEILLNDINSPFTKKVGMVFQNFNLFSHFTVLENLTYAAILNFNYSKEEANKRAYELLEKFQLSQKIHNLPKDLSGGQKQRVAICRALMLNPEILLFDEPTSALDPNSIQGLIKVILELKSTITIVVVTHFVHFAKTIADRVVFLNHGIILSDQKSDEFFSNPTSFAAKTFLENSIF
jgi:ABC-type polar amino acid transport system ATPase subunit